MPETFKVQRGPLSPTPRYIDANLVLPWYLGAFPEFDARDVKFSMLDIDSNLRNIPTEDVRPVITAKPVQFYNDPWTGRRFTTCSACSGKISKRDKFCKHCGAEMKGGEQNGRL